MNQSILSISIATVLVLSAAACAQTSATQDKGALIPTDPSSVLSDVSKLASQTATSIDLKALGVLAQSDIEKKILEESKKVDAQVIASKAPVVLINVIHPIEPSNNTALTYIHYKQRKNLAIQNQLPINSQKTQSQPQTFNTTETVEIGLNPIKMCISEKDIRQAWDVQFKNKTFNLLGYGSKVTWTVHGPYDDSAEQKRRGDGPSKLFTEIYLPKELAHQSEFTFTYDFWLCARSITLERKY